MEEPTAKRARTDEDTTGEKLVPVTLISGFLGAGKTSLLKNILENKSGLKVGVIVNDVAEVNIDKSLVSTKAAGGGGSSLQEDTIELQNGCACCSVSEEFLEAIEKLMQLATERGVPWDHIVVESSGVAEPREIRDNFRNALTSQPEVLEGTELHTLVTVVDGSTFLEEFEKRNKINQREDLGKNDFSDQNARQVVDLMCEQVECCDVLILNKSDLIDEKQQALLKEALTTLNPTAKLHLSERGKVDLSNVLAAAPLNSVAKMDEDGEHRHLVAKVKSQEHEHGHAEKHADKHEHGHAEKHEHGHAEKHEHGHADEHEHGLADKHEHGHVDKHEHGHVDKHEHGHVDKHEHGHVADKCDESKCTHEHDHAADLSHEKSAGREEVRFGITSFCYQRRRPFHPHRLKKVVMQLPVRQEHLALSEALTKADARHASAEPAPVDSDAPPARSPMQALIRSKGFMWLSNSDTQIFYWALAGKHFELTQYAQWWQTIPRNEWPEDHKEVADIEADFDGEWGDRRQELVFIGVNMDKAGIVALLDECLLTDVEMGHYRKHYHDDSESVQQAS